MLLEDQLRQSQKMDAIGKLAGGIAHDFNNLLTIISGYSNLMLDTSTLSDSDREGIAEIRTASDRAASLTRQLLAFSRQTILQPVVLDLNVEIAETSKMIQRLIGEDIELRLTLDPAIDHIKFDPGQLNQVLINLAVNARDAMPKGGLLTIETARANLSEDYATTHLDSTSGPHVMLAVSDSGCGMTPEIQARIFEPFFTTKELGKGTGLGLATVFGIVQQSGGFIHVYSEVDRGTTFKIYLSAIEREETKHETNATAADLNGNETVLIVEDEEGVRSLASRAHLVGEPQDPRCHVQRAVLRRFELGVVLAAPRQQALGDAQQPARLATVARQHQVDDGAPEAPIAILVRVDGLEPQVGHRSLDQAVGFGGAVEPFEQPAHLLRHRGRRRRFEVHRLAAEHAADDLHRLGVRAVAPDADLLQARVTRWKQRRLPGVKALVGQRLAGPGDGVVHHVEQAVDVPGRGSHRGTGNPQPAGHR